MQKLIITAVMLGTCTTPALAIPPKYHGDWCGPVYQASGRKDLVLCVPGQTAKFRVKVEANQITVNGVVGKTLEEFTQRAGGMGQFEQWIVHYDFGTQRETYQFERHTKPDGRALLDMRDLTDARTGIGAQLRMRDRA